MISISGIYSAFFSIKPDKSVYKNEVNLPMAQPSSLSLRASPAVWSNLPTEIQLKILSLCSVKVWGAMQKVDRANFELVNVLVKNLFKPYIKNPIENVDNFYPLLFSKEAKQAIKKDAVYQKYISVDCIQKIKAVDYIEAGRLILFGNKFSFFGKNKNAYLPLSSLPNLRLDGLQEFSDINPAIKMIEGKLCLCKEWTLFIIKNFPSLLTQEKEPDINSILNIPIESIQGGLIKACENYYSAIREHFPASLINRKREIIKDMLKTNMFVDDALYEKRTHPILWAVLNGKANLLKLLIKNEFNLNAKNEKAQSALHIAAMQGKLDMTRILINGFTDEKTKNHTCADIHALDNKNKTPLHYARQYKHTAVAEYLVNQGAN